MPDSLPSSSNEVLLIEDDSAIRDLLQVLLRHRGAEVTAVSDCRTALRTARDARRSGRSFAFMLIDLHLPGVAGRGTLRGLRRLGVQAPAIACTASDGAAREHCLAVGFVDFLPKPFSLAALSALCQRYLQGPVTPVATQEALADPLSSLRERFRRGLPARAAALRAARSSPPLLQLLAHRLHGAAASFGLTQLAESARAVVQELALSEGTDVEGAQAALDQLLQHCVLSSAPTVSINHELRTLLTAILGCAELLTQDNAIGPAQRELAGIIREHGERLLALITRLGPYLPRTLEPV